MMKNMNQQVQLGFLECMEIQKQKLERNQNFVQNVDQKFLQMQDFVRIVALHKTSFL